jgi:hypothetical protein
LRFGDRGFIAGDIRARDFNVEFGMSCELLRGRVFFQQFGLSFGCVLGQTEMGTRLGEIRLSDADVDHELFSVHFEKDVSLRHALAGSDQDSIYHAVMQLLSGGATPMESMPVWLQYVMRIVSPSPHFVAFSQAVLYRGADLSIVWPMLAAMAVIGSAYFVFALKRFRRVIFGS